MEVFNTTQKHLRRAIDLVGGQSALARAINSKQQNVWFWLNKSGRVPAEFVLP
ncbi:MULTISPECIES: YdaS family helix-turn-helix protein, partial [Vibrio]